MNLKAILNVQGHLLLMLAVMLFLPAGLAVYYQESPLADNLSSTTAFFLAAMLSGTGGYLLKKYLPIGFESFRGREGFVIVALSWILIPLFGALPFYLTGVCDSFTDAYFESMSGFTTTGATIFSDLSSLSHSLLFWRNLTQWLGGMGIIMLILAVFPELGIGSFHLFKAEVPGGTTVERIQPRLAETAKILWKTYVILTVAETLFLYMGGMNLFDAVCHSFSTVSTGGFSPYNENLAHFESWYLHGVVVLFMFLSGMNFTLHYHLFHGEVRSVLKNPELRVYTSTLAFCVGLSTLWLWDHTTGVPLLVLLEQSLFTVLSINTTTGFTTVDYNLWPVPLKFLLVVLMMVGGCSGSTSGGIKSIRLIILFKIIHRELARLVHPRAVIHVHVGGKPVGADHLLNAVALTALFATFASFSFLLMMFLGVEPETAGSATFATLSVTGPGLAEVGPSGNYAHIPLAAKWMLIANMLLGRLEMFSVILLFLPMTWRK